MLLHRTGALADAAQTLEAGLELARKTVSGFTLLGQARLRLGETEAAHAAFSKALDLSEQPYPLVALLLLGQLCLDASDNARAKELYLYACRQAPSCSSWLGAGVACHRLGEADQAEEALAEANVLNNRHPLVWGNLALLCVQQGRDDEAQQALRQAYKLGLADAQLLLQLGGALFAVGKWSSSEAAIRRALLAGPSAPALQALGNAQMEQHLYEDALASYKEALSVADVPKDIAEQCRRNASHILHFHLNRPDEAAAL
jgi:tetratricopeptide (TPR) repeat protein